MKDITGRNPVKKKRGKAAAAGGDGRAQDADVFAAASATPGEAGENSGSSLGSSSDRRQAPARRKAPTDSTNVAFEEWLRGRRPRDFLAEQVRRPDHGYYTPFGEVVIVEEGGEQAEETTVPETDARAWLGFAAK